MNYWDKNFVRASNNPHRERRIQRLGFFSERPINISYFRNFFVTAPKKWLWEFLRVLFECKWLVTLIKATIHKIKIAVIDK